MATLKQWLDDAGFNWAQGRIIYHPVDDYGPGSCDRSGPPSLLQDDAEILHADFDCGYGCPMCPRIVAEDATAVYFPWQYDGATDLQKVYKNLDVYLRGDEETPYPGGG